ncbi:hypothetical protein A3C21_02885 [Candidatus Kaiserbacteria bacterium RIFCSPHIGHO2_02_FULL_59_21]|uniref:DUF6922 domain-containing protein n=2 Tax=Candidatus Kaiseribacteriota TaxID=1752734 RepID=A0A0G1YRJ5_9BACT|nr:MAG: hypothetical protein UY98_C0037G0011 [Candidatus Kaiserbacteria bacterium GW2011_GWA2_58_9]OGG66609.1 MAG: hypothetical protein A3C21_02885 [Candidatus Kaiserbacteria bacterium RIFCSPHIGHO2_02_FULL_59_21]OGG79016.1 MAG: hypothetical protein A2952_01470 [Candidatus Kaiserbacteria bacterium RIFCSPLOWO2_01_FULL_59_34]OGG84360.1 MAG: hypothetical protein A3I47_01735 [Candidatus Kaiserbacteria bacterium RIFCSPLOWO2_02_FULL_59_19]
MATVPSAVRASLWSYDIASLDLARDKNRIIFNVLNYGADEAVRWLFKTYSRTDIANVIRRTPRSEWSKKSLNFWSLVLKAKPERESRLSAPA